jgi:hypothetical protein
MTKKNDWHIWLTLAANLMAVPCCVVPAAGAQKVTTAMHSRATVKTSKGDLVVADPGTPQPPQFKVIRLSVDPKTGASRASRGLDPIKARAGKQAKRGVKVYQLKNRSTGNGIGLVAFLTETTEQTPDDYVPAENVRVKFSLSKPIGELLPADGVVSTNSEGEALITFIAGRSKDSAKLTANIAAKPGNPEAWDVQVIGFWTLRNQLTVGSAVAAAAAVAITVPILRRRSKIKPVGPPIIIP